MEVKTNAKLSLAEQLKIALEENAKLREANAQKGKLTLKISEKGGLSIFGLQRFPVTLYREQWERLLAESENIKAFLSANAASFSSKADKVKVETTPTATF